MAVVRTHSIHDYLFGDIEQTRLAQNNNRIAVFADPLIKPAVVGEARSANALAAKEKPQTRAWNDTLERLPYSAREARNIESIFKKDQVNLYLDQDMTKQALMDEQTRRSRILHIATHGYYNPATPDVVGFATSPIDGGSGFLSLTELLGKPFYSDLVIVSGCETMLGEYYKGSGMRSLTRGLLSQGAGSVIGTLWKVPDLSTSIFMGYFYQALKDNNGDSGQALFTAKLSLSTAHKGRYSDPYYWAGFVLTTVSREFEQIVLN